MPISTPQKVFENRVRRVASRQGYIVVKSPRRDRRARDWKRWAVLDAEEGWVISGAWRGLYSWTLADLCGFLRISTPDRARLRINREPPPSPSPRPYARRYARRK